MKRPLAERAFSLIELMVAMAIASILMLLLVQFVQMATTAVVSGEDSLYRTNDAQAALDMLAGDLRSLKFISTPMGPLTGTTPVYPPEILQTYNDAVSLVATTYVKPQSAKLYPNRLYLLANSAGSDGTGSGYPHLIAYRVAWQDPLPNDSGNEPILGLYRDFVSQSDTFGYSASGSTAQLNTATGGIAGLTNLFTTYWNVNAAFTGSGSPNSSPAPTPPVSDLLVGNVIDFQIYFYDANSPANPPTTPTQPLNPASSPTANSQYVQSNPNGQSGPVDLSANGLFINQPGYPSGVGIVATPYSNLVVEIKLTVLTNKGVEIMNSGGLAVTNQTLLNRYARTFVRRIPLNLQ